MFDFLRMIYAFVVGVYSAVNVEVVNGVGFMDIMIGFIIIALVITVFWKGARV